MEKKDRKAAKVQFKERKSSFGIFAVVCTATGEVWVGTSRNLDAQKNSLWLSLRHGTSFFSTLRTAWALHGEREFRFEELDRLKDDFSEILRANELKKRQILWTERLQASSL
jgi:hypothetical protein